jgi:alanyl-tRNA synthetase
LEAITGRRAVDWAREQASYLGKVAGSLGVPPERLEERLGNLQQEAKERERQIVMLQRRLAQEQLDRLQDQWIDVDGVAVLSAQVNLSDVARLREMGDRVREKMGSGVILLGTIIEGQARLVAMVTSDLVERGLHAGRILRPSAEIVGGKGGGRPEMAQGGGPNVERLAQAIQRVQATVSEEMSRVMSISPRTAAG